MTPLMDREISVGWLRRNPWFDEELAPLRARVAVLLGEPR